MAVEREFSGAESLSASVAGRLGAALRIDWPLFMGLVVLAALGLFVLYSANGESMASLQRQLLRMGLAFSVLLVVAQISPTFLRSWSFALYLGGLGMLIAVLLVGDVGKGAQRWLDLGVIRFQPSELMKIVVPMMVARYVCDTHSPPSIQRVLVAVLMIFVPVMLIVKQPDLGTALLVLTAGMAVLFLAGIPWRLVLGGLVAAAVAAPVLWHNMHAYQRQRVMTFLNPEADPLGSGYHIIQSKIAIGSGGLFGKGWLNGTQSHLDFLPERHTDFIFAVFGEEFGLLGGLGLLAVYAFIVLRGFYVTAYSDDHYGRLLAGAMTVSFLIYLFVNIGMVTGLLPVVGVPLPMVSYGGTSMVTMMAGFGIVMSVYSHRRTLS
ncbi:MAG TPA: rod shape-determining protein RodA [Gammaproteobacteria bacterium]|nr:rod shape-determining protein RodA [Gammaproteobacteria bacterium]